MNLHNMPGFLIESHISYYNEAGLRSSPLWPSRFYLDVEVPILANRLTHLQPLRTYVDCRH